MELAFNWLDWVIMAGLAAGALWGYARGLIGVIVGSLGYFVALIAAGRLTPFLVDWLDEIGGVTRAVADGIAKYVHVPPEVANTALSAASAQRLVAAVQSLPLPDAYKEALLGQLLALAASPEGSRTVGEMIFGQLAHGLVSAGAFVAILLVGGWLLSQIGFRFGGLLDRVPLVGTANRLLGSFLAVFVAGATVSVMLGLSSPLASLPAFQAFSQAEAGSSLVPHFNAAYEWLARWFFGQMNGFFLESTPADAVNPETNPSSP